MSIRSISCALPFCSQSQGKQSQVSCVLRTTLVALGVIALLVGTLALSRIRGLHALGTVGGSTFIIIGSLTLMAGLCLRCVQSGGIESRRRQNLQSNQNNFTFVDPRATGSYSSERSITRGGKTTTVHESYCSLERFLTSTKSNDTALYERLAKEVTVSDLRIKENFGNHKITLALPLKHENDSRDDDLLFQILKLIYLPKNDLLSKPLKEIETYGEDARNILSLRLMHIGAIPECSPGTLGAFLSLKNDILSDEVSPALYYLFTKEQVILFLQNAQNIDSKIVTALFPSSENQPFITNRSVIILSELPIEDVHRALPFLNGQFLWPLIRARGQELNYDLVTQNQVNEMLPYSFIEGDKSTKKMEELSIETLNCLLPKMDVQLNLLPDKHLKNRSLNLRAMPQDKIKSMFPISFMEKEKSRRRVKALHSDNRNYVETIVKFDRF